MRALFVIYLCCLSDYLVNSTAIHVESDDDCLELESPLAACPFTLQCPIQPTCAYPQVDRFAAAVFTGQQQISSHELSYEKYGYSVCDINANCFDTSKKFGNYDCSFACDLYKHIFKAGDSTYTPSSDCACPPSKTGCTKSQCLQIPSVKVAGRYYYVRKGNKDFQNDYLHSLLIPGYAIRGIEDILDSNKWRAIEDIFEVGWKHIRDTGFPIAAGPKKISETRMAMVLNSGIYRSEHQLHIHLGVLDNNFQTSCLKVNLKSATLGWNSIFSCSGIFGSTATYFPQHNKNVELKAYVCDKNDITQCNFAEVLSKSTLLKDWHPNSHETGAIVVKQQVQNHEMYVLLLIKSGPGYLVDETPNGSQCAPECLRLCNYPLQIGTSNICKNRFGDHQILHDIAKS